MVLIYIRGLDKVSATKRDELARQALPIGIMIPSKTLVLANCFRLLTIKSITHMKYLVNQYNIGYQRGADDRVNNLPNNNTFPPDSHEADGYNAGFAGEDNFYNRLDSGDIDPALISSITHEN